MVDGSRLGGSLFAGLRGFCQGTAAAGCQAQLCHFRFPAKRVRPLLPMKRVGSIADEWGRSILGSVLVFWNLSGRDGRRAT